MREKIPHNRAWLYSKGIKLLLKKWNAEKQIDDWEVGTQTYQKLDIEDKEGLLIEIAAQKFENPQNFVLFEQKEIVDQIVKKLKLTDSREGIAVLKAIETQHGLLIERADELWSFSHLTFQEYFTVQWLTQLSSEKLSEKIANQKWQEIVKQLVKSQQPADRLVKLIKQAIDNSIAYEPKLQVYLEWLFQKSVSIQKSHKPVAIRVFYYALDCDFGRELSQSFGLDLSLERTCKYDENRDAFILLDLAFYHMLKHAEIFDRNVSHLCFFDLDIGTTLQHINEVKNALELSICLKLNLGWEDGLRHLKEALLVSNGWEYLYHWWKNNGSNWVSELRRLAIEHCNICRNWKFTTEQQQQLERYYNANAFLTQLMNIEGSVSVNLHNEIEDTLLLSWNELQRRQPELYRDLA